MLLLTIRRGSRTGGWVGGGAPLLQTLGMRLFSRCPTQGPGTQRDRFLSCSSTCCESQATQPPESWDPKPSSGIRSDAVKFRRELGAFPRILAQEMDGDALSPRTPLQRNFPRAVFARPPSAPPPRSAAFQGIQRHLLALQGSLRRLKCPYRPPKYP